MISNFRVVVLALVPAVAVALGGGVPPGARAWIFLMLGVCLLFFPMRAAVPWWVVAGCGVLALWPLTAFLPVGPDHGPWREQLEGEGFPWLGSLQTVQPWLSAEAGLCSAVLLAWAVFLTGQPMQVRQRLIWMRVQVGAFAVLTLAALLAYVLELAVPGWPEGKFGPFPNRNQTGTVLAIAGVVGLALGLRQLRHGHREGWGWLGVTGLFLVGLLVNGSRAGLILFLGGCGLWCLWNVFEGGRGGWRFSRLARAATIILLLGAVTLLVGGTALDRILKSSESPALWMEDARLAVQRDALALAFDHPWRGTGLANFEGVFAFYRNYYQGTARPLHPESDWLWLAGEAGWPAVSLLAGMLAAAFRYCWPGQSGGERRLRQAALVAAGLFLFHSMVDVPGHRLGSLLTGMACIALVWPGSAMLVPPGRALRIVMMAAGGLSVLLGAVMLAQLRGQVSVPSEIRRQQLMADAESALRARQPMEAIRLAQEGIQLSPLDWRFHFLSAQGRLVIDAGWDHARREFARARMLEPDHPETPLREGALWIGKDEERVMEAWKEAMRRTDRAHDLFHQMRTLAGGHAGLWEKLEALVAIRPELEFYFLAQAKEDVFERRLAHALARTPAEVGLRPGDARGFFSAWRQRRGDERFVRELAAHPAWEAQGWPWAARALAAQGKYREALELTRRYLNPPAMPGAAADPTRARQTLLRHPDDLPAGFSLAMLHASAGDWGAAVRRLEHLSRLPGVPAYVFYALAEARRHSDDERGAWEAMAVYLDHLSRN